MSQLSGYKFLKFLSLKLCLCDEDLCKSLLIHVYLFYIFDLAWTVVLLTQ